MQTEVSTSLPCYDAARVRSKLTLEMWDGMASYDAHTQVQPVPQGFGSEAPLIEEEAPDITDEAAYSIQEDKLKTEDDNRYA